MKTYFKEYLQTAASAFCGIIKWLEKKRTLFISLKLGANWFNMIFVAKPNGLITQDAKKIATRQELLLVFLNYFFFATFQVRTFWKRVKGKYDFYTRVCFGSAYFFKKQLFLIRTKMNREICLIDLFLSKVQAARHNFTQKDLLAAIFEWKFYEHSRFFCDFKGG